MRCGVRCADTMRASNGTPSACSVSAAWRMVAQSDWLPMIRPTSGRRLAVDLAMKISFSGDDIGNELTFQLEDLVLESELALLEALQLQLVEWRLLEQPLDDLVEVAMLAFQRFQLDPDRLQVDRIGWVAHAPAPQASHAAPGRVPLRPPEGKRPNR